MSMAAKARRPPVNNVQSDPLLAHSTPTDKSHGIVIPSSTKKWAAPVTCALLLILGAASIIKPAGHHTIVDNRYMKRGLTDYHDLCIVGAGLSGSVIAERYASQRNQTSLIIERRDHIGGNVYDYIDEETGIRVSKYGAHLFHTYYDRVWDYVQQFSEWTPYEHEVIALINGKHVPVPVNIDTVNALFELNIQSEEEMDNWLGKEQIKYDREPQNSEEMAKTRVGERLYELIFHPYTIKQWAKEPRELGPEVTARIPVRNNHDGRYFADPHQALPTKGYTAIFEKMYENPLITVKLNTDFFDVRRKLKCGKMYYSGPIDRYFADLGLQKLEYRSLDFERRVIKDVGNDQFFQPKGVVNHPNATRNYTRIVEYKHFLNQINSPHTILFLEHSKDGGEPYYPVPNPENKGLFEKYKDMAAKETDVTFVGRLANYKYFNMDQTIENALTLFDDDTGSVDLIIEVKDCHASRDWIKQWDNELHFNNTFIYSKCGGDLPLYNSNAFTTHSHREDLSLASGNVFVQGPSLMRTPRAVVESLRQIKSQAEFCNVARLPFDGECSRNVAGDSMDGREFFISREAIKRYLYAKKNLRSV